MNKTNIVLFSLLVGFLIGGIWVVIDRFWRGESESERKQRWSRRAMSSRYMANFLSNVASTTVGAILIALILRQNLPFSLEEKASPGENVLELLGPEGVALVIFAIGLCIITWALGWGLTIAADVQESAANDDKMRWQAYRVTGGCWIIGGALIWALYLLVVEHLQ